MKGKIEDPKLTVLSPTTNSQESTKRDTSRKNKINHAVSTFYATCITIRNNYPCTINTRPLCLVIRLANADYS